MTQKQENHAPDPARMAWYELNDAGNAFRLRDLAQGRLLWVEDHWMAYDGQRWNRDAGERMARKLAQDVARHIPDEAAALIEKAEAARDKAELDRLEERIAALYKHAIASGNSAKLSGMLNEAHTAIFADRDDFDADPLVFNVQNGTLRLVPQAPGAIHPDRLASAQERDGRSALRPGSAGPGRWTVSFGPHNPADMLSRIAEVEFDPEAVAPYWERHMATVLPAEPVREFFRQCVGYGFTGEITEQCIFLLQGKGGDGKSTTMNVLRELGGHYGSNADVQTFVVGAQRSGGDASPDLARLAGDCRIVSTGEPRAGAALDEGRIKQITGGAAMTARELHGTPFEYIPRFKVFFECNRKPRISGDDDGIWRRVVVIQFPHQFKGAAIDKHVHRRLLAEGPGVLNWVLRGALDWLEAGTLAPPEQVQEAIEDYRRSSNPFGEWFAERVDTSDPEARVESSVLFNDYKSWCEDNAVTDREIMTSTGFGRALGDKQIMKGPKNAAGRITRRGAKLRDDSAMDWSAEGDGAPPPRGPDDYGGGEAPPGWEE